MKAHGITSASMLQRSATPAPAESGRARGTNKKRKLSASVKQPPEDDEEVKPDIKQEAIKSEQGEDDDEEQQPLSDGSLTSASSTPHHFFPDPAAVAVGRNGGSSGGSSARDDDLYVVSASDTTTVSGAPVDRIFQSSVFAENVKMPPGHTANSLTPAQTTPTNSAVSKFGTSNWLMGSDSGRFYWSDLAAASTQKGVDYE